MKVIEWILRYISVINKAVSTITSLFQWYPKFGINLLQQMNSVTFSLKMKVNVTTSEVNSPTHFIKICVSEDKNMRADMTSPRTQSLHGL